MIEGLRPYPEMAETGVAWLSSTPRDWLTLRAKYVFREVDRKSQDGQETHLSMHQKLGLVPSADTGEKRLVSESYAGGKLVEPNDLVLNRLKAHLGVFAYATRPGVISPDYTVLRPLPNANVRYYEYLLKSPACRGELRTRTKGIVEGFWRLYTDDFYDIRLPVPPLDVQRLVVRFLDWHGAMTVKLIRAKRRLIALLNEQKQSIIHRAVTRGLDPSVTLKPSGADWLGDVPQHWEVMPLKRASLVSSLYGANYSADYYVPAGVRFLRTTDIDDRGRLRSGGVFLSQEHSRDYLLEDGDFLISRSGTVGRAFVYRAERDGPCAYAGYLVRYVLQQDKLLPDFLWAATKSPRFLSFLKSAAIVSTIANVNGEKYANLRLAIPPLLEQEQILSWISQQMMPIDVAIGKLEHEIALIQEFRIRIIADVVTGQLDVRALAASLSEIAEVQPLDDSLDDAGEDAIDAFAAEEEDA